MSEFLAEARILVRPDTTAFRATLEAELKAITATPITVPVVAALAPANVSATAAATAAATSAAAAQKGVAVAAQEAGAAAAKATVSTVKLTSAQKAAASAAQLLALAQSQVVGDLSAVGAAQVTLTRSSAALSASQKAVGAALRGNNAALVASGEATLALAADQVVQARAALSSARANTVEAASAEAAAAANAANAAATQQAAAAKAAAAAEAAAAAAALKAEAAAAREAAAAQAAHAASLGQLTRGAGASGLTLFGLRGATLAASGAFLAGTAAVVAFSKSIQSAAQLETELNVFRVTAGATADEMDRVSASAKQLGRDITLPGVTASSAATAMTELAKAGLSVQDSLAGARGALQLATAAQIDVKDSTNLVAGALNAFQLSGDDAVRVADLLTGAAKESQGEITDMGTALSQAAAVSRQFGVSIEDTVTLLTELAQAGIAGGRAGTSLRVAFLRLVNPPAAAAEALKKLNVQIRDAEGNLRPQIFTDISEALQGYTKAQRDATLATIFGSDAIRAAGIIGAKGTESFKQTRDAITELGLAQEAAAARTSGLQGDFENLSNQVSSLGLTLGTVAKGPTSALVKSLAGIVTQMNLVADASIALITNIVDIDKAILSVIPGVNQLSISFGDIAKATTFLNPVGATLNVAAKAAQVFGVGADEAGKKTAVFGNIADSATESVNGLAAALKGAAAGLRTQLPQGDTGLGVKQIQNVIVGFDAEEVRAKIKGDNAKLIDVLNTEQAFLERQLNRDFVKRRPALQRAIEQALLGTVNDIEAVQSKAASAAAGLKVDAEKAARDAASAVKEREQALLSSQGLARDQRQNRIAAAAETAGLGDDISQQKKLKALVLSQIAAVKDRISVEGGRAAAITALRAILVQIDGQQKALIQQQQAAQAERRQNLIQSTTLDIDLAQITGNQQAEVAARKKLITQLKAQQALVKRGTLEWKQLRNDIATQNAAIAAVTAEKKKQNNAFGQASFEFLQAQQGFASNLLGNLIPGTATGGLVGGGSVSSALTPVAGAADGRSQSGPTSGQANASLSVQRQILGQLKILNGDNAAPEARYQNRGQRSVMDGVGGG